MGIAAALIRITAGLYVRNQNCVHFNLHTRIHVLFCFFPHKASAWCLDCPSNPFSSLVNMQCWEIKYFSATIQLPQRLFSIFSSLFHSFLVEWGMRQVAELLYSSFLGKKKSIEMMRTMIAKSWVKTAHWKPKCHCVERKNYLIILKIRLILSTGSA